MPLPSADPPVYSVGVAYMVTDQITNYLLIIRMPNEPD
jgi:hypothetical protein